MLLDFVELAPGDWVVQNGANSAVNTFSMFKTPPSKLFPPHSYVMKPFVGGSGSDPNSKDNGGEDC